jgi:ABC-type phosphate transport system substrate-binding protein
MALAAVLALALVPNAAPAQAAGSHAAVQGSGSSWAYNAVNQWISDVAPGLQVNFNPSGSAQGRKDFANVQVDFAISDIGFQGVDPATGLSDTSQGRAYAYLPIVGGGTSFPYQIRVRGRLVDNLRLSGTTLALIFTNQISNWNDSRITADNNGRQLPDLPIIPVVHSEGSGSTFQFTRYLATEFPNIWTAGATEYFRRTGPQVAENGSDSMINFITSGAGNGAIGYDEYSYALNHNNWPVAKVLNKNGYYTLPNQYNVAVALTQAQINMDRSSPNYLLQNLNNVYVYNKPQVYPISSYSYMIIPTAADDKTMSTAKRQTIADYLYYSICQGQKEMGPIGYSPLPINLVEAGFQQIGLFHTADPKVILTNENVTTCHNPTFVAGQPTRNYLAEIAPLPEACDKQGAGPCTDNGNTGQANPGSGGSVATTGNGGSGSSGGGGTSGSGGGGGSSGTSGASTANQAGAGSTGSAGGAAGGTAGGSAAKNQKTKAPTYTIDPATGQQVASTGGSASDSSDAYSTATVLAGSMSKTSEIGLAALCAALLLAALIAPPVVAYQLRKRSKR